MKSLKLLCFPLLMSIAGCMEGETATPTSMPVTVSQRVDAPTALPAAAARGHLPPVPQPMATRPVAPPGIPSDSCPEQKKARPDRAELALAKARLKADAPKGPEMPVHVPPPPAEVLERQARFLEAVKQRRFDHLPPAQREAAYSAFKRDFLGE